MTLKQAELIVKEMSEIFPKYKTYIYEGYSGREMHGDKCIGIVTDNPLAVLYCAGIIAASIFSDNSIYTYEEKNDWFGFEPPFRKDNIGLDTIIY